MKFPAIVSVLVLVTGLTLPALAADAPDPSQKLREQLRGVMLQLRTAQTETANAQAAQAAAEAKNAELAKKIEAFEKNAVTLAKQASADKATAQESITKLNTKLEEREKRLVQFNEALEKFKAAYQKVSEIARTKEDERAKLASEAVVLKRTVADREAKNIALFNTSNEILDRYENYALGKALGAREPFIGTTRVKIENLVQGYKDKILDNRISAAPGKP